MLRIPLVRPLSRKATHPYPGWSLTRLLAAALLMARLACQRLEINWELCLHLWLNRPVIEVVLESPVVRRKVLLRRVNEMFPF